MKWTKKDVRVMCGTLTTFWLLNRPLSGRTDEASTFLREYLGDDHRRIVVVCDGIANLADMCRQREQQNKETADHYASHPNVMGEGTPEIVERFTKLAAECARDVAWGKALREKIQAHGLPPEVLAFDPTAPVSR